MDGGCRGTGGPRPGADRFSTWRAGPAASCGTHIAATGAPSPSPPLGAPVVEAAAIIPGGSSSPGPGHVCAGFLASGASIRIGAGWSSTERASGPSGAPSLPEVAGSSPAIPLTDAAGGRPGTMIGGPGLSGAPDMGSASPTTGSPPITPSSGAGRDGGCTGTGGTEGTGNGGADRAGTGRDEVGNGRTGKSARAGSWSSSSQVPITPAAARPIPTDGRVGRISIHETLRRSPPGVYRS